MISIFIMYSPDRAEALDYTIKSLRRMPLYGKCQRTLVVDSKVDYVPPDWGLVEVPRIDGKFCWGRMWDAGVCTARYDKVLYLDSDRLLPRRTLELISEVKDYEFAFTSQHYQMTQLMPHENCVRFVESESPLELLSDDDFLGTAMLEPRFAQPFHGPQKNVMSGFTAFTKETYYRLGGVDHWYCGHGAFADNDFHLQASMGGCEFTDLNIPELHFPHDKLDGNKKLSHVELYRLGLDNFIYYCWKWELPMALAEGLAHRCDIQRPTRYVEKRLGEIKSAAKVS